MRDYGQYFQYTLPQILMKQAERFGPDKIAIREKQYGVWNELSWQDYLTYTRYTALGLLRIGLKRGEYVGIVADNRPEWLFSELGAQAIGSVTMNLFASSVGREIIYALSRVQVAFVIVQDQEQVDKLLERREELSLVRRIIYIDPKGMSSHTDPWLLSFAELLKIGEEFYKENPDRFEEELWKGKPDEIALLCATSGTTGLPKFAMIRHRGIADIGKKWLEFFDFGVEDDYVPFSPPAWVVGQMWFGVTLLGGLTTAFPETPETFEEDFREVGLTFLASSSRFWEALASTIRVKIDDASFVKRKSYALSQKICGAVIDRKLQKMPVSIPLRFLNWLASILVFRPLLDRIGLSRTRYVLTGGHPISPDVIRFYRAIGLNLKQSYGSTETGGIIQIHPDDEVKFETVGKPLPGVDVKISEDQEVLVRSESNFSGYYQDPEETQKILTDGWVRTGDAGYIDGDGHLVIVGRKEEIVRTAGGEACFPDFIETRLKFSPFIKEAVSVAEARPYLTAMINIDEGNVGNWAERRKIAYTTYTDLSQQPLVEELICKEVHKVNTQLPDAMKVRKILLLYKLLDADDQELTQTGKLRRNFVLEQYRDLIEAMYGDMREIEVEGKIRYRDGRTGTVRTKVKILSII